MAGWVFRRPHFRQPRRTVVPTRGHGHVHVRRRALQQRARHIVRLRRFVAFTFTAAATAGHVSVRQRRLQARAQTRIRRARPLVPTRTSQEPPGALIRVLRAVQRARRRFQQRLRWKPNIKHALPPQFEQPHATERGTIDELGAVEGTVQESGARRGVIQ